MAFRLGASGPLRDDTEAHSRSSFLGSAMGAFKDKASAAATAASAAAGAAVKSAKHGIEVAKDALGPSGTSSASSATGSFQPPPRTDEDLDLQRALEASMCSAAAEAPKQAPTDDAAEGDRRPLAQPRHDAGQYAEEVQQLQSMGFAPDLAQVALSQSGGDVSGALAFLCGEGDAQPRTAEEVSAPRHRASHSAPYQRLDGGRASTSSTTSSVQAQAMASYQSAKASLLNVKRRAEALFGQQKAEPHAYEGETFGIQVPKGFKLPAGQSLQQRQASLEAAERRLAEARARNAGTMEDWRRYTLFRQQEEREQREAKAKKRASAAAAESAKEERVRADEEEDLQRAMAASVAHLRSAEEAGDSASQSLEEDDPEVFELRLQQAIAEEELQLQQALIASLEAEREALEEVTPTCSAAATGEELEAHREQLSGQNLILHQITSGRIQESREREKQLKESNEELQSRLDGLREALAERSKDDPEEKAQDEREEKLEDTRPKSDVDKKESPAPTDEALSAESAPCEVPETMAEKKDMVAQHEKDEDDHEEEVKEQEEITADDASEKVDKQDGDKEEDGEVEEEESEKEKVAPPKAEEKDEKESPVTDDKAEGSAPAGKEKAEEI